MLSPDPDHTITSDLSMIIITGAERQLTSPVLHIVITSDKDCFIAPEPYKLNGWPAWHDRTGQALSGEGFAQCPRKLPIHSVQTLEVLKRGLLTGSYLWRKNITIPRRVALWKTSALVAPGVVAGKGQHPVIPDADSA